MPEFLSLGEAARTLGLSDDELKRLAQERRIRAFMDGGSWRFRKADVEEEARRRGMGSDPELPLSDLDIESPLDTGSDEQIDLTEFQIGVALPDLAPPSLELPRGVSGTDDELLLIDDRTAPQSASGSSSKIIGIQPVEGKRPSDSDVRLVPQSSKGASDSDVRLGGPGLSDSDVTLLADEAGSSQEVAPIIPIPTKKKGGKPAKPAKPAKATAEEAADPNATILQPSPVLDEGSAEVAVPSESDSDFDLTPSSVIDMLEPESGSDFELTALDGSSDEIDTAAPSIRRPSESDVTGMQASSSGVNLGRPSDSGINLQAVGGFEMDAAESIELEPIEDEKPAPGTGGGTAKLPRGQGDTAKLPGRGKPAAKPAAKKEEKVDLSATALPVRSEKDIFEDTDFDVDVEAIDSSEDDRTVQLEARSDFDVEDDSDSASEVFAVDENEEDVDANAATAMGPAVMEDEGEFEESVSGETPSAWDSEEAAAPAAAPGRSAAASPAFVSAGGPGPEWGGLWVGLLGFTSVLVLLGAFMGMDLVRNLYYFQGNSPASGLIQQIAGLF